MSKLSNIVSFYKECYESDFRAVKVDNVFGRSVECQLVPESLELLSGRFDLTPVSTEWAEQVEQVLHLDSKEKILYAGSFFIGGTSTQLGKTKKAFCPLYLHELKLSAVNGVYYLSIDGTSVNPAFLEICKRKDPAITFTVDELEGILPSDPFGFDHLVSLKKGFKQYFTSWDISSLDVVLKSYDRNLDLKRIYRRKSTSDSYIVHSGLSLGIFKKPTGSYGVIFELNKIAEDSSTSELLNKFFLNKKTSRKDKIRKPIYVPLSLSEGQQDVFYTSDKYDVSLVVGPPGTGKSITIASLALDIVNSGRSVLVASNNNQAGKVVLDKMENDLGVKKILVNAENKNYRRSLKAKFNKILYGHSKTPTHSEVKDLLRQHDQVQKEIDSLFSAISLAEKRELKWGEFYSREGSGVLDRLKSQWIKFQKERRETVGGMYSRIKELENKRIRLIKKYVRAQYEYSLDRILHSRRSDFIALQESFNLDTGNARDAKYSTIDFELILKAIPAWVCNASTISNVFPLQAELFDVLIIDEASQCDISSMIPLLYRAKKVVVIGDPHQLRQYSFLSQVKESSIRKKYNLQSDDWRYRGFSLIDLTSRAIDYQDQVVNLQEHYRSYAELISFSNKYFYNDSLEIMRSSILKDDRHGMMIKQVSGTRSREGINDVEAREIVQHIRSIIRDEELIANNFATSLGVISPFTRQVKYIKSLIKESIDNNDLKKHSIFIGTPVQFQGQERDMVLMSFVVDDNTHAAVFNYLNREDVFNVSVTRARNLQLNFVSLDYKRLNSEHLLSQYLCSRSEDSLSVESGYTERNKFSEDVISYIEKLEIDSVVTNYPVSGVDVDILVVRAKWMYCIDLIGYPGQFEEQFSAKNMRMLARMNHEVFFLPYSSWYLEPEESRRKLSEFIGLGKVI